MSDPFVGEIQIMGFNFAPKGWALCQGQTLPISQNTALFSLIGTYYGGNGTSTFQLPNLQGLVPVHQGQGPGLSLYDIGETSGSTSVTLLSTELPEHNHTMNATAAAARISTPTTNSVLGSVTRGAPDVYINSAPITDMAATSVTNAGSSTPHNNMMPYLVMNYCIALTGIFPERN